MKKYQVAIIGTGFGSEVLVPAFRSFRNAEISAICGRDPQKVKKISDTLGIPRAYQNWKDLLEQEPFDILAIAVPPRVQQEILLSPKVLGKAIFAEKPLGISFEAVEKIYKNFSKAGTPSMVDFEFSKLKTFERLKETLGLEGDVLKTAKMEWRVNTFANRKHLENWKTNPIEGGVLGLFGSHAVFNLEWFFGEIATLGATLEKAEGDPRLTESILRARGTFRKGGDFELLIDTNSSLGPTHLLEVTTGRNRYELANRTQDYMAGFELWRNGQKVLEEGPTAEDGRILPVRRIAAELLEWMGNGIVKSPNFLDGYRVQLLLQAIRDSSTEHGQLLSVPIS